MVVELMGRNAGWLALHAGIASGSDIILIPEIPYDLDVVCEACEERNRRGKRFTLIAVSEGAAPRGGQQVVDKIVHDSPDPVRLGGIGAVLAEQIAERTGCETRATILGHVQRGGTPVAFDRVLATEFGFKAVELIAAGRWNELVVMQHGRTTTTSIASVAGQQRRVPVDGPLVAMARAVGTSLGA
jgi:ATP-dependent phosphofructokinase / diphosphate-dependent phosphofructokinase